MGKFRGVAIFMCALFFFLPLLAQAPAPESRNPVVAAQDIDPAKWGPYVKLAGHTWQLGDGYLVSWEWLSPSQELGELWTNPNDGKVIQTNVIRPGEVPGQLVLSSSLLGMNLKWQGRVGSASEVVWAREGMIKLPYRLRIAEDGRVLYEGVKLKQEQVTDVKYTHVLTPSGQSSTQGAAPALASIDKNAPAPAPVSTSTSAVSSPSEATTQAIEAVPALSSAEQAARNFGAITRYDGVRLIGDEDMLEVQVLGPDQLAVQFFGPDGKRWNRYLVRARADKPGQLELLETVFAKNSRPDARLGNDGVLYVESQDGWFSGWRYAYEFKPSGNSIATVKTVEFMNGLRIALSDGATTTRSVYRPLTQDRVVQALEASRQNAENERIAQENRRRQQAQSEATWNAALQGFSQGAAQAQADHYRAQAEQDAFLAQTAAQAGAVAARAQRQREEDARQAAALVAASSRPVASAPPSPPPAPKSNDTTAQAANSSDTAAKATRAADEQAKRKAEQVAQERQKAEAQKLAAEQAKQRQQQEWQQRLQQARNTLQLRADTCLGGGGRYYVIGPKTSANACVTVHYEARCQGAPQGSGVQGSQHNYIGGSCMGVGDAIAIPGSPLACPAGQVVVRVTDVTGC